MRIIVTRPERDAQRWAADFAARGHDAVVLPLIDIAPLAPGAAPGAASALAGLWQRLGGFVAVMFVSTHAAEHFFRARPDGALPQALRFWAPGPGTAETLRALGVPAERIDGPSPQAIEFDSERLWAQVEGQISARSPDRPAPCVLFVRGGDASGAARGRDWLARQVSAGGGLCEDVVVYERRMPAWTQAEASLAGRAASDGSVWLFSSSEAVTNLKALIPLQDWSRARAVATHPRIAQAARDAGFGVVKESRPTRDEVLASIESAG